MKVTVEFDTTEKTLMVMEDGKEMADVRYVNFYPSYEEDGKFCMTVEQGSSSEDGMVMKRVMTMAKVLGYHDEN